jgi:hypothetical protein
MTNKIALVIMICATVYMSLYALNEEVKNRTNERIIHAPK